MSSSFFIIIVLVLLLAVPVSSGVKMVTVYWRNQRSEAVTTRASVVDWRVAIKKLGKSSNPRTKSYYYVSFATVDGVTREFRVKYGDFLHLKEHSYGTLVYQGTRFVSYQKDLGMDSKLF